MKGSDVRVVCERMIDFAALAESLIQIFPKSIGRRLLIANNFTWIYMLMLGIILKVFPLRVTSISHIVQCVVKEFSLLLSGMVKLSDNPLLCRINKHRLVFRTVLYFFIAKSYNSPTYWRTRLALQEL